MFICIFNSAKCRDSGIENIKFEHFPELSDLPTNEVNKLYLDREGFMWIGSSRGLYRFDGYSLRKFHLNSNDVGTNNAGVVSMADDSDHNLWIGTKEGLYKLSKPTGEMTQVGNPFFHKNLISNIIVTQNNQLIIGTDRGLCNYIHQSDSCVRFNTNGNWLPSTIKGLAEARDGSILVGSWSEGLHSLDLSTGKTRAFPRLGNRNSAHVVFEDSRGVIWVGTWGEGLYRWSEGESAGWENFRNKPGDENSLLDDVVYSIEEDSFSGSLWIGSRAGLSVINVDQHGRFRNFKPDNTSESLPYNELNSIVCDRHGLMWFATVGGGIYFVHPARPEFRTVNMPELKEEYGTNSIRSLLVDKKGDAWFGLGSQGLFRMDSASGRSMPLPEISEKTTITSIYHSKINDEYCFGMYDRGVTLLSYGKSGRPRVVSLINETAHWLRNYRILSIAEDSVGNYWIGTQEGLYCYRQDETGEEILPAIFHNHSISALTSDSKGNMWAASSKGRIWRIKQSKGQSGYDIDEYEFNNLSVRCGMISFLYPDSRGSLWAGSDEGRLMRYDETGDEFVMIDEKLNLPVESIDSMEEDDFGNLWLGTNRGLLKLMVMAGSDIENYRLYTMADGLPDNVFNRGVSFRSENGELYFGGHKGLVAFNPEEIRNADELPSVRITDIRIFNKSWSELSESQKSLVSESSPGYAEELTIPADCNNFSIEFATLSFENVSLNSYAYKLVGHDDDWQFAKGHKREVFYNNLAPGNYSFKLTASNRSGVWSRNPVEIKVRVLPPVWKTWWAYLIYMMLMTWLAYLTYRLIHYRWEMQNALALRELEKAKADEINHTKLQFFTNVTHELLTPLTIISAGIDQIRRLSPDHDNLSAVMNDNAQRLIRLLQQILEFRKAESGNLKLKVSKGDVVAFVGRTVNSFEILMKRKGMSISLETGLDSLDAYFDTDKFDKIVYNLLSNAAKYNKQGTTVVVRLLRDEEAGMIELHIQDNGEGMSNEEINSLFRRFYEGNYRKFNTIGTGIGLSLTKDLVELHHGSIAVSSKPGEGALFVVRLPYRKGAYSDSELDSDGGIEPEKMQEVVTARQTDDLAESLYNPDRPNLLLVEDNEDLCMMMEKLLMYEYNIFSAVNGFEALQIVEQESISLIVSDLMMPAMDGLEFCRRMKGDPDHCHIPIVLLTARIMESDRIDGYEAGADDYMTKPVNLAVLQTKLRSLIKARERNASAFRKQSEYQSQSLEFTSMDETFIQKCIECVHNNMSNPDFDSVMFTEKMGATKSTVYRKLKSLTGLNTSAFIRNIRLKAACSIFKDKRSVRISEVAFAVGFNDPKYFTACFKKEFGMVPKEYIEQLEAQQHVVDK